MKRFDFPLDRVRRWRAEQLHLEELKLQQFLAERQALARGKQQVREELQRTQASLLAQPSMDALELENLDSFRHYVHARIRDFENRERQAEARIIEQRQRVLEARRHFELLERLRHKALAEWRAASDHEQETLAAELFLAKTVRNG